MNYTLKSILGEGGMAIVHLAEDHKFHTEVAVKMLKKEFVSNENIKKRFLAEARSMFRMSHPNVIKVTDLIDEEDTVAFVMEYVEGETLKVFLERKGALPDNEVREIFSQMLDAVGYVHEQNLVHRDIKPSNFMIDKRGKVKLMDFGIAKSLDPKAAEYTQTGTGIQMGTPMYMSPEQIKSTKEVTAASDIYSLGVVLWQMVTGQKPYDTKDLSNFELQTKIVTEKLGETNTLWDKIIQQATAKDCLNRYNNSKELKQEMLSLSSASVEESDSTQIEIKKRVGIKEKNPNKKPQIKRKPAPEISNPMGAEPQKTNSNPALYMGVFFVSVIIGALILFLWKSSEESLVVDLPVQDSISAVDSLIVGKEETQNPINSNLNHSEKNSSNDGLINKNQGMEESGSEVKNEGLKVNNKEVDDSYFNTFDRSKSKKIGIAVKGAKLRKKPEPHGYVTQEFNTDKEVEILDFYDHYYKVCYGSNCGFINEIWITNVRNKNEISERKKTGIAIKGAKLKRTPDPLGDIIQEFNSEKEIQILEYSNQYYKVCYGSFCGYMSEVWVKNIK